MIHDESSFDIRQASGVKVPPDYGSHFKSFDGRERKFMAESSGGASWMAEYNVLAGLSSRSFGRFSYFVTRIASGRVERGLPLALRRCGYNTLSLYPAYGAFMGARGFQTSTGIQHFYDARDLGAKGIEPDSFFYDKAVKLIAEQPANTPLFTFVYLAANHFPWETKFRPDLLPSWRKPGNAPVVDEYLRRQTMSAGDYAGFIASLKKKFPAQPFLIVRYGDHQPEFSSNLLDPGLDEARVARKFDTYDPRYFTTYYAIDAINFEPVKSSAVMDTDRRALSAAGDPGSRRHSARPVVRGTEEHHAPLQGCILRLQGRRRGAQVQPVIDRGRFHQGALRHMSAVAGPGIGESLRRAIARRPVLCAGWPDRCRRIWPALAVLLTTEYGPFAITLSVLAWVFVNCFPAGRAAAARRLRGAGADLHRDPDRAVALQVRNSAANADVPRLPDHRPRYVFVPALGVSAIADAVDRGGPRCGSAVVG